MDGGFSNVRLINSTLLHFGDILCKMRSMVELDIEKMGCIS